MTSRTGTVPRCTGCAPKCGKVLGCNQTSSIGWWFRSRNDEKSERMIAWLLARGRMQRPCTSSSQPEAFSQQQVPLPAHMFEFRRSYIKSEPRSFLRFRECKSVCQACHVIGWVSSQFQRQVIQIAVRLFCERSGDIVLIAVLGMFWWRDHLG